MRHVLTAIPAALLLLVPSIVPGQDPRSLVEAGIGANAGPNQTAKLRDTVVLNGSGSSNPSGIGALTYHWKFQSRPAGSGAVLQYDSSVTPAFVVDVAGNYVVDLTVSNGVGSQSASVTVSTINTSPVADAGLNQTVAVGSRVYLQGNRSYDVDGDLLSYQWSLISQPAGSEAKLTGANTLSPAFVVDQSGEYVALLGVSDGMTNSSPATVTITTRNSPPVADAGVSQVMQVPSLVQLNGAGSTDVDGDLLSYQWSLIHVPVSSQATLSSATAVNPTFNTDVLGTYVAQLMVRDGQAASVPSTVTISTGANQAPTAHAGPNQAVRQGALAMLNGAGTDPQNLPLTYRWALITTPAGSQAALSSSTIANPSFFTDLDGAYVAQLMVSNGVVSSAPSTVTISTHANTAPVANAGPNQSVALGAAVTLDGTSSSDADNHPLTYTWSLLSLPEGSATTLSSPHSTTPVFVTDVPGTYVAQLIVNDGVTSSNPATVTIATQGAESFAPALHWDLSGAPGRLAPQAVNLSASVVALVPSKVGIFRPAAFMMVGQDVNGNIAWDPGIDQAAFFGTTGDTIIYGDWDGTGTTKVGIFRASVGMFALDMNGNGAWDPGIDTFGFFGQPGDVPIVGDWNGDGRTKVGIYRPTTALFAMDYNGNLAYDAGTDKAHQFGLVGDTPIIGDWNGDGKAKVGVFRSGLWILDSNNNLTVDAGDTQGTIGQAGDTPLLGDWNGDGRTKVGIYRSSVGMFAEDYNGNLAWDNGVDRAGVFGAAGSTPVVGDWTGTGVTRVGVFYGNGYWGLDINGNLVWDAGVKWGGFGSGSGDTPVVGRWKAPAGSPASITATSGTPQNTSINTAFAATLAATVKDAGNNPVSGVVVTFTAPASGASGTFANGVNTATTNASGVATSAVFTANATVGSFAVSALAPSVATPASFSLTNTAPSASSITANSGTPQSTVISTAFAAPLVVTVRDAGGNPVSGALVTFTVPASGASGTFTVGVNTATTNASGVATSAVFTANTTAGSYAVSASATGVATPASFSMTNMTGPATTITATIGTPQSTPISTAFSAPLVATVRDSGGNGVSDVLVTFTAPAGGASGTFAGGVNTATTNASGVATSVLFTANGTAGSYFVVASVFAGGVSPVDFALSNTVGTPASITATSGTPQSATISTAFAAPLTATVRDSGSNLVSGVIVTFTAPASGPSGSFAGGVSTATTNASGVATAAVFTANGTVGSYSVAASVAGVATPANFSLTNTTGVPSSITATSGTPQSAAISIAFGAPLVATVKDSGGNPVSGAVVTFGAPGSGASGTFAGGVNTATTNASGVATSAVFTANSTGGVYAVIASVGVVATPATFTLTNTATAPASILTTSGTPQSATIGTAFAAPLVATVHDAGNNPVSGVVVIFTAPGSGASGTFAGGVNTATTNASGVATSAVFTANLTAGGYSVAASIGGLGSPANFALTNTPGSPSTVTPSVGTPQSVAVGTAFAPLAVTVLDANGNPVGGVLVTFGAPGSGASGAFTGGVNTATTNTSGVATSAVFTANSTAGSYTVTASATGVATVANFLLTNVAGAASSIIVSTGTQQSTAVGTSFSSLLVVTVRDASSNPVSGVLVTFTAPIGGASGTFAGGFNTATTNSLGIASSAVLTANGTAGVYTVTASVGGVATPANFSLTNTAVAGGNMTLSSGAVGKNLETAITLTLPQPAPPGELGFGLHVTLTSADQSKLLLAGRPGDAGAASIVVNVPTGLTIISGIFVQGLASSGTVVVTASAANFNDGAASITLSPSGFSLASPGGAGTGFTANQGSNTALTVTAVRLDPNFQIVQEQQLRGGFSVSVPVTSSATSVGVITNSPVVFNGGDSTTAATQFNAANAGNSTLAAGVPAGFSALAQGSALVATVNPVGLAPGNITVGKNLETTTQVTLIGTAPAGGVAITLTSNNPSQMLLSTTATGPGFASIMLMAPAGFTVSPAFYVRGLGSSGAVTYTATATGFGSNTGTVTLAPSGFVVAGPFGFGQSGFLTTTGSGDSTMTVYSALLDSSFNYVSQMPVAVDTSVTVASSNSGVGTITSSPVTITQGNLSTTTAFHPLAQGTSALGVTQPAGFSTPAQFTSVTANVSTPGIAVTDGISIGFNLETSGTVTLGAPAPAGGLAVTLISNSGPLLLSNTGTGAGSGSITINIPAGSTSGAYYLQSLSGSGTATYTASAPGFNPRTGTITLTPSGPVIAGAFGLGTPFFSASMTGGNVPITVYMGQLDPGSLSVANIQALAGGLSVSVSLTSSAPGVGTIASPVTINGGILSANGVVAQFTPVSQGSTIVAPVTPLGGYTGAANDNSLFGQVGP